jgi:hypothetical protein
MPSVKEIITVAVIALVAYVVAQKTGLLAKLA